MWFKMNFQLSSYSALLLPCRPQRKACIFTMHLTLPPWEDPIIFGLFPFCQGWDFILFGVFFFCFVFILVVSSQLVTTKNVDIGIWLICYCIVVLPQQFEKLQKKKKPTEKQTPATVFLRSWNLIISCRRADKGLPVWIAALQDLVSWWSTNWTRLHNQCAIKVKSIEPALECSWKLPIH